MYVLKHPLYISQFAVQRYYCIRAFIICTFPELYRKKIGWSAFSFCSMMRFINNCVRIYNFPFCFYYVFPLLYVFAMFIIVLSQYFLMFCDIAKQFSLFRCRNKSQFALADRKYSRLERM